MTFYDRTTGPMELVDRDTLHGMVVPWMKPARVMDDDAPAPYLEQFHHQTFDRQIDAGATNKGIIRNVTLQDRHDGAPIGYALDLDRSSDGLLGTFRVRTAFVDDVKRMHDDGIDGLSMRFLPFSRGGTRLIDGIVTRVRAVAVHVALVATPAYTDARVHELREDRSLAMIESDEDTAAAAELAELEAFLASAREGSLRWGPAAVHTADN